VFFKLTRLLPHTQDSRASSATSRPAKPYCRLRRTAPSVPIFHIVQLVPQPPEDRFNPFHVGWSSRPAFRLPCYLGNFPQAQHRKSLFKFDCRATCQKRLNPSLLSLECKRKFTFLAAGAGFAVGRGKLATRPGLGPQSAWNESLRSGLVKLTIYLSVG